ncbi:5' nucleotidase, NT5C type [Vibrio harveyi]|uniref:5' nucleotidase, NT5C type n=1 Tax=Vibrio harveyi TaxID=669 RepID=UPI003CF41E3F
MKKEILYLDMDNTLVSFESGIQKLDHELLEEFDGSYDLVPGIFGLMEPMPGAIDAFKALSEHYDCYILSTAPWNNPTAWSDKLLWVKRYLGDEARKRLILSHNKHLNIGRYLVDDRVKNGAGEFTGELIQFGTDEYPDWDSVLKRLIP